MSLVRRSALLSSLYLLAVATSASAEEPKGFLTWPWGTTKETMFKEEESWCPSPEKGAEVGTTIICHRYSVGDVSVRITLNFLPDDTNPGYLNNRLAGYLMFFGPESYVEMRTTVIEKFGPPTSTSTVQYRLSNGALVPMEVLEWRWPSGTTATLMKGPEGQRDAIAMLRVATKAVSDLLRKNEEEKGQERRKGFP